MKKTILLVILATITFTNTLTAQDLKKELDEFAKKFETAYNKKDEKAIKSFYTEKAVWTNPDGSLLNGNEAISSQLAAYLAENDVTLSLKQNKNEKQTDGSVVSVGTYKISGKSKAGETADHGGTYTNTMVKEDGQWKISKSVLVSP